MAPKKTPQTPADHSPTSKEEPTVAREDREDPAAGSPAVTDTPEEESSGYNRASDRDLEISDVIERILKLEEALDVAELKAQIEAVADAEARDSVAQELEGYMEQVQLQKHYLGTPQGKADTQGIKSAFHENIAQIDQMNMILGVLDKNTDERSRELEGIFRESLGLRRHLQTLLESPQVQGFQGFSSPTIPFEVSSESEYELLNTDHTSGEDEVLGESFNLPYKGKFVPGNRIHKQLAWYQNHYREQFYAIDKGDPRFSTKPFPEFYGEKKQGILKAQAAFKEEVGSIRKKINRNDPKSVQEYHAHKRAGLKKSIGHHYITTLKEVSGSNRVYPNFATAKLSYVTNDRVYSKFIVIPRGDEEGALDGHSEKQIFQQTKKDIIANNKYRSADLVVLDINTAMSMCESGDNCYQEADRFIHDMHSFIKKDKLKVRISYNFRYNQTGNPLRGDEQNLFQKQIALPDSSALSHTVKVKSIVISSGYQTSRQHTQSIQETDKLFDSEIAEYAAEYTARLRNFLLSDTTIDFTGGLEFLLLEALALYNKYDSLAWEGLTGDRVRKIGRVVPGGFTDVNDNGHCFYHAVALQLSHVINPPSSAQLQAMAIDHIINHPGWYHAFLIGFEQEVPGIAKFVQDENYARALEVYINYHLRSNDGRAPAWADNLMMAALSNALRVNFNSYLFNIDGSPQLNEDGSQKVIPIVPYTGQSQYTLGVGNLGNIHFVSQDSSALPQDTILPSLLGIENFDGLTAASGSETDQIDEIEGEPSAEVIHHLDQQGNIWMEKGNYARALLYYQEALKMKISMNSSPLGIAFSHNNIGNSYLKQSNYKQALDSFYKALDIHRDIDTTHKDLYADCLDNVGLACRHTGEYRKAFEFHQQALSIRQDLYKKPHPSKAKSLNNIGLVHKLLGQYEEALGSYQKALSIWKEIYGHKPNPHTATLLNNIASVYVKQKKYDEALESCEKGLEMRSYIYQGKPHLDLAHSYSTLANIYGYSGDYDAEIANQLKALEIMGRILKEPHKDIATSLNNMGAAFRSKGEIDRALKYYMRALEMRKALHPGQDHRDIVESLYNIGLVYEAVGNHDNALSFHEQALEMRRRIYEEHSNLERLHNVADQDDQAPKMRKRTYESHPDQKYIAKSYEKVASIHAAKGNRDQALQNYVEALKILQATNSSPLEIERINDSIRELGIDQPDPEMEQDAVVLRAAIFTYDNPILNYHGRAELFSSAFKIGGSEMVDSLFGLGNNQEVVQEFLLNIEQHGVEPTLLQLKMNHIEAPGTHPRLEYKQKESSSQAQFTHNIGGAENLALAGGALMKFMEVKESARYLFTHYIPVLPIVTPYLKQATDNMGITNILMNNENLISTGLHFLGGLALTHKAPGSDNIPAMTKFIVPLSSSSIYGIKQYAYDLKGYVLSSLNDSENSYYFNEATKAGAYMAIGVGVSLLMSLPFALAAGTLSAVGYSALQGAAMGFFSYYNTESHDAQQERFDDTLAFMATSIGAAVMGSKLLSLPSSTTQMYAVASMLPALASMHLASKFIYNIAADFMGNVAENFGFGTAENLVGVNVATNDEL